MWELIEVPPGMIIQPLEMGLICCECEIWTIFNFWEISSRRRDRDKTSAINKTYPLARDFQGDPLLAPSLLVCQEITLNTPRDVISVR